MGPWWEGLAWFLATGAVMILGIYIGEAFRR